MRNLMDRSVYDCEDEVHFQAYLRRASRVTGVYMGVTYAVGALVILLLLGDLDLRMATFALVASAWGGAAVAAAVRRWTFPHQHRERRAIFERVYDGDPALVPPPPADDQYPLRLPCGLLLSWRIVMGGVLYLGPAGFLFVPHLRNAEALREAVRMEPVRTITLRRLRYAIPWPARLSLGPYRDGLLVEWRDMAAMFVVPDPDHTLRLMEAELVRWKFGEAS
ncbi:MAG TPA: hypothetical protein VFR81_16895 [Longimicrobium sp.]|nr:hypothetical protein [Longimicrobium sp.]